jgi:hypothetical protein
MSEAMMVRIAAVLKVGVQYFFDELPSSAKNGREIKTPILIEMSLATHGHRLMDAFLNLKSDKCAEQSPISRRRLFERADGTPQSPAGARDVHCYGEAATAI